MSEQKKGQIAFMPPPVDANYPLHTRFPSKTRSEMANKCFAANIANILSHMVLSPTCQHTLWLGKYGCRPGVRTNCFAWCLYQMRAMDNRQGCTMAWASWVRNFWACYFQHGVRKEVSLFKGKKITWPELERQLVCIGGSAAFRRQWIVTVPKGSKTWSGKLWTMDNKTVWAAFPSQSNFSYVIEFLTLINLSVKPMKCVACHPKPKLELIKS